MRENPGEEEDKGNGGGRRGGKSAKVSRTDPDASMATLASKLRPEPSYKRHAYVDDARGVVLDVAARMPLVSAISSSIAYAASTALFR